MKKKKVMMSYCYYYSRMYRSLNPHNLSSVSGFSFGVFVGITRFCLFVVRAVLKFVMER